MKFAREVIVGLKSDRRNILLIILFHKDYFSFLKI